MKKTFLLIGTAVSLVIALLGILLWAGAFASEPQTANSPSYSLDYGYAAFGADFYTYVANNSGYAAYASAQVARNQINIFKLIKNASGIFLLGFGLICACAFLAKLFSKPEPCYVPTVSASEDRKPSLPAPAPQAVDNESAEAAAEAPKADLVQALETALKYNTDDGMAAYLRKNAASLDEKGQQALAPILGMSLSNIRPAIQELLDSLKQ